MKLKHDDKPHSNVAFNCKLRPSSEVDIHSDSKAEAERLLCDELVFYLTALPPGQQARAVQVDPAG